MYASLIALYTILADISRSALYAFAVYKAIKLAYMYVHCNTCRALQSGGAL